MEIRNVYAGIMTKDIETAREWYNGLLGKEADYHPMNILFEWTFPEGGVLQLVQDKERAGHSSITLLVKDIDIIRSRLNERGIVIAQSTEGKIARTITILDPENNRITFAENIQGR